MSELIQHHLVSEEEKVTDEAVQGVSLQMQSPFYVDDCLSDESKVDEFQQTSCKIRRSASIERPK